MSRSTRTQRSELAHVGRVARRTGTLGGVVRNPDAGEQQRCQGLPQERGDLGIEECHPSRADAECIRGQVQAARHDAGIELGLAVPTVVEAIQVDRPDDDERGITPQVLPVARDPQLVPEETPSERVLEVRPAVESGREPLDGMDGDEVRGSGSAERNR